VLLVGLGAIGMGYDLGRDPQRFVQTHARAFARHRAFHLCAGVDPDAARRQEFTQAYAAPAYDSIDAALASRQADVVVISTPTASHAPVLDAVLARCRPRAVLCEKPLAESAATARAMLAACDAAGVPLYVNYFRRALPAAIEVRDRLADGRIATPAKACAWYTKGLLHNGSHLVDLLGFWLGALLESRPLAVATQGVAGPDLDCYLRFQHGDAVLRSGWADAYAHFSLELLARNGRLQLDRGGAFEWQEVVPDEAWPGYHSLAARPQVLESCMDQYQGYVVDRLARLLAGHDDRVLCDGLQAVAVVEGIDALFAAGRGSGT
jgi:predicted dehydrogenase